MLPTERTQLFGVTIAGSPATKKKKDKDKAMANPRISNWISEFRDADTALLQSIDKMRGLLAEYVAIGMSSVWKVEDFAGNEPATEATILAALNSIDAITTLLSQGHATNLYRVRK